MGHQLLWLIVVIAAIVILAIIVLAAVVRRRRKPFDLRPLPADLLHNYESRIPEIEQMFVNQPREAVAAARMLVDDMYARMGYPARMHHSERVRDIRHFNRDHAHHYGFAANLKQDATTEEMRRALRGLLDTARSLMDDGRKTAASTAVEDRTRGRELAG
jgi:hypothetical protein